MVVKPVYAIYDGKVFKPLEPLDLEPNTTYEIMVVDKAPPKPLPKTGETVWEVLDRMTGTMEGPGDWSAEHDHYLYGTPKRDPEESR